MREFLIEHGAVILASMVGSLAGYFMWLAYYRRLAVDRLVRAIENCKFPPRPEDWRQWLKTLIREEGDLASHTQDAAGRVIARSVERVTRYAK